MLNCKKVSTITVVIARMSSCDQPQTKTHTHTRAHESGQLSLTAHILGLGIAWLIHFTSDLHAYYERSWNQLHYAGNMARVCVCVCASAPFIQRQQFSSLAFPCGLHLHDGPVFLMHTPPYRWVRAAEQTCISWHPGRHRRRIALHNSQLISSVANFFSSLVFI